MNTTMDATMDTASNTVTIAHTRLAWIVILTASLFFFYEFIQLNMFNAIAVNLMNDFHLSAAELGNLSSMYFYADALLLFPAGILLDRFSTRKIIVTAVITSTIGTFLFAIATTYPLAAFGRFLEGCAAAFCFLSCLRLASRWFPPRKMAFVTGVVVTMAMLGGLVAQTPFAILSHHIGWRHAVMANAMLGAFVAVVIYFVVQDRPPNSQETVKQDKALLQNLGILQSVRLVIANPYNWLGGLYTSLMNLPVFLLGALWGIHYLVQVRHISPVEASYATTLFFLGVIFGSPAFGWLSDHIGRRVLPMVLGAIASLVIIFLLMYMPNLSLSSIIILFFLIGFVTSSQVLSYPTLAELNPTFLTGTAVSIDSILIMIGGAVFQPLFGWVMSLHWDQQIENNTPIYAAGDFMNAMWIMPIAFVVSLIAAFLIKETYCQSQS